MKENLQWFNIKQVIFKDNWRKIILKKWGLIVEADTVQSLCMQFTY